MKIAGYPEWKVLTSYSPQLLFELPDAEGLLLLEVNADGVITYVNAEAVNQLGWLENQLLPEPIWQTLRETQQPTSLTPGNEIFLLAVPLHRGWFLLGYRLEDLKDLGYTAALLAELRSLVEHAPLFIAHLTPEGDILTASQFARSLIEFVQPTSWVDLFHPDERISIAKALQEAETEQHVQVQARLQVAPGIYEPFEVYLRPLTTPSGLAVEVIGIPIQALETIRREKEEVEQQLTKLLRELEASQQERKALQEQLTQSEQIRKELEQKQKDTLQHVAEREARIAQLDKMLLREKAVFYHFLEHFPFPIIEADSDNKITYLNSRAIQLFQLGGTNSTMALSAIPGMEKVFALHIQQWLKDSSRASTGEVTLTPPNRPPREVRFFGISLPEGDVPGRHFFILEDLTEQKKLFQEAFLQKSYHDAEVTLLSTAKSGRPYEVWLKEALDTLGRGIRADRIRIFKLDTHSQAYILHRHWTHPRSESNLQVPPIPTHFIPDTSFALISMEAGSQHIQALAERLHCREAFLYRFHFPTADTTYLMTLEHDRSSNARAWVPMEHSLVERLLQVFQTLNASMHLVRHHQRLHSAPLPFLAYRLVQIDQIHIGEVSPALKTLTGFSAEELAEQDFLELVYEEDQDEVLEHWKRLQQAPSSTVEFRFHHKHGSLVWIKEEAQIVGENGSRTVYAHWQDVTEKYRMEAELEEARKAAASVNQLKSAFLATMSHEIRTPLGAIKGYAELLVSELSELEETLGKPLSPQIIEFARSIRRNGQQALELINELFDYIHLETGMLKLRNVSIPLHEVILQVTGRIAVELSQKGVDLRLKLASEEPVVVGDPQRVEQILEHLLSNAAKFTQEGSVTIRTEKLDNEVLIEITDTGVGMSEEFLEHLFTPFSQEDHGLNRQFGGKGLSMALVKRLLDLMEGRIEVESQKGKGTTFRVYLPMAVHAWVSPTEHTH